MRRKDQFLVLWRLSPHFDCVLNLSSSYSLKATLRRTLYLFLSLVLPIARGSQSSCRRKNDAHDRSRPHIRCGSPGGCNGCVARPSGAGDAAAGAVAVAVVPPGVHVT